MNRNQWWSFGFVFFVVSVAFYFGTQEAHALTFTYTDSGLVSFTDVVLTWNRVHFLNSLFIIFLGLAIACGLAGYYEQSDKSKK